LRAYIDRVLPEREWGGLAIPLTINAVDLESGYTVWFGAGGRTDVALPEAVYASSALPVFYPPAHVNGMHLVDGGIMDAVPITKAADRRADRIIAVTASAGRVKDAADTVDKGMISIHHRVMNIMSFAHRELVEETWFGCPVIHVRPRLDGHSTFDFDAVEYFLAEGYRATRAALVEAGVPAD
jgi:NTE family protein